MIVRTVLALVVLAWSPQSGQSGALATYHAKTKEMWDRARVTEEIDNLWLIKAERQIAREALSGFDERMVRADERLEWARVAINAGEWALANRLAIQARSEAKTPAEREPALRIFAEVCFALEQRSEAADALLDHLASGGVPNRDFRDQVRWVLNSQGRWRDEAQRDRLIEVCLRAIRSAEVPAQEREREEDLFTTSMANDLSNLGRIPEAIRLLELNLARRSGKQKDFATHIVRLKMLNQAVPEPKLQRTIGEFRGFNSLQGKVSLLVFTAHWCGPCLAEVPHLARMASRRKDLRIVSVTSLYGHVDEKPVERSAEIDRTVTLLRSLGQTWPLVYIAKSEEAKYGVYGLPMVVVIDKRGRVRDFKHGFGRDLSALEKKVDTLLRE